MMRYLSLTMITAAVMILTAGQVLAQDEAAGSFESLKSLEGNWEGINPEGQPVEVTYQIVSGGSAVMETLKPKNEPSMITVYHMDDGKLMMTHYCSAGNQPRMHAKNAGKNNKQLDFTFVDGTNMQAHSEGHMQGLSLIFEDADNLKQVWTFQKDGKEMPGTFKLKRKV